jgi:3-hydroxyisobutyrate dehydrogenase
MGAAMCRHLIEAGHAVKVFTRTEERARPLVEAGAQWCTSPAQAAAGASIVCTMVGFPADVRQVVLGEHGVLRGAAPGTLLVDFTTSEPALAEEISARAIEKGTGTGSLDAPVSGGDVGARNASLVIVVGGHQQDYDRALPVLRRLGKTIVLTGGPGSGQHAKMANQIAIASGMVGVCEALLYAWQAGLDVGQIIDTIGNGAAGSWSLNNYGPRALRGDFEPGFKVDHFIKDLGIALAEARRLKLSLPGLALAEQLYVAAAAQGRGQKGTHSLLLALAQISGRDWAAR